MIINEKINLFKADVEAIIHQANCMHTMGSGVAAQVKVRYPEAYAEDLTTPKDCIDKLGTFSCVKAKDGKYIYNLYSQYRYGTDKRHTDYEAFYKGIVAVHSHMQSIGLKTAAVPYKIGSDRGGASWGIIYAMLDDVFEESNVVLHICQLA